MLTLDEMVTLYPDQVWLDITPEVCRTARQTVNTQAYGNSVASERAYRNIICQTAISNWLREEPDLPNPVSWVSPQNQPSWWEFLNGFSLLLDTTRLVIIPSDAVTLDELSVEQEWVDIPAWAAHYYLAVQLNLEDGWLRIVGYTTHHTLKQQGRYDKLDQTYTLDESQLIEDLNVLWIARDLSPLWQPIVEPLPSLPANRVNTLITQLSQYRLGSPRLDLPPEQWLSLIAHPTWQEQLYHRRTTTANLLQWMQNKFESGWQAIQDLSVIYAQSPAYALAKGFSPQEKVVDYDGCPISIMLICDDFETIPHPTDPSQILIEAGVEIGVRLVRGELKHPYRELPADLEISLTYPNEIGDPETITEHIAATQPNNPTWFPPLIVQSGQVVTLELRCGDWCYSHDFTL